MVRFPIYVYIRLGHHSAELLRTWMLLRRMGARRGGWPLIDEAKLAQKLGCCTTTLRQRLKTLVRMGFLHKKLRHPYRLVSIRKIHPKYWATKCLIRMDAKTVNSKESFAARLFAATVELNILYQDARDRVAVRQGGLKLKEASLASLRANKPVKRHAELSFSYLSTQLRTSKSTISKLRRAAVDRCMLNYQKQTVVVSQAMAMTWLYDNGPAGFFYSRKEKVWKSNSPTRYSSSLNERDSLMPWQYASVPLSAVTKW